jgi:hypothetical protein
VAQDLVTIILGTIKKVDSTTKTIVVKTAHSSYGSFCAVNKVDRVGYSQLQGLTGD